MSLSAAAPAGPRRSRGASGQTGPRTGLHPDGLAAVYGEHPAAIEVAFASNRSEVLGALDPLAAVQQVHWGIHRAFIDYQTAAEERRQLAADTGELIGRFVHVLVAAGWSEQQARNANVHELAQDKPATPGGTKGWEQL